jgi:hypothetical protein
MAHLLRGALIEYGSDFLGPIPNVVIFQFNPETLTRVMQVPPRPLGPTQRETGQAGEPPIEKITLTAVFSAADQLNDNNILARTVGIGPQLAALEKMIFPVKTPGGLIGAAIDAIGSALGGGGSPNETQPVPRQPSPRVLFIWGLTRLLPVVIESMTITEQQYDALLNPVEAQVSIGLAVTPPTACSDDIVAKGAMKFTDMATDTLATVNLANTVSLAVDMIPF